MSRVACGERLSPKRVNMAAMNSTLKPISMPPANADMNRPLLERLN